MIEYKAPDTRYKDVAKTNKIFFAGSIEQGKAVPWQQWLVTDLVDYDIRVLNPRRDNWDANLPQDKANEIFNEQVNWELDALKAADYKVFFFDPATTSPITLLELGLYAATHTNNVIVCCPDGYYRRGNVIITCERYNVPVVSTYQELLKVLKNGFCKYWLK